MLSRLSEYGLTDPQITAVRVDDELILVAAASSPSISEDNGDLGGGDNDNLLVVPSDGTNDIENNDADSIMESGARVPKK